MEEAAAHKLYSELKAAGAGAAANKSGLGYGGGPRCVVGSAHPGRISEDTGQQA